MTVDRVSNAGQSHALLAQATQAQAALDRTRVQVATGKVATDYGGYGDKIQALEAARSAAARADAYRASTQLAVNQADLQNTQLSSLATLADNLRQALTKAVANNDASGLIAQAQSIFDQAQQILNSKDTNGNYLYGGTNDNAPPVTVNSLSALAGLGSVAQAFANSKLAKSVAVADGESVKVGVLASDVATNLLQTLKSLATFNAGPGGNLGAGLTQVQSDFLTGQLPAAVAASQTLNAADAANGDTFNRLKDAATQQQAVSTLYQGFVGDIENVDLAQAISNLNQNQVALQATLQVTAQLNKVSLLNFLPAA